MGAERREVGGHQVDEGLARDDDHAALSSPEPRSISCVGTSMRRAGPSSPSMRASSSSAVARPSATGILGDDGQRRLERVGEHEVVEPDHRDVAVAAQRAQRSRTAPTVIRFWAVISAVGGSSSASSSAVASAGRLGPVQLDPDQLRVERAARGGPAPRGGRAAARRR